jgi:hypothetical protein
MRPDLLTTAGSHPHPRKHRSDVDHAVVLGVSSAEGSASSAGRDRRAPGVDLCSDRTGPIFGPASRWTGVRTAPSGGPSGRGQEWVRSGRVTGTARCRPGPGPRWAGTPSHERVHACSNPVSR